MAKISPGTRERLKIAFWCLLVSIVPVAIAVGLFHRPFESSVINSVVGLVAVGLFSLARTRPRLSAVLWAGVWALVAAGVVWIIEDSVSGTYIGQEANVAGTAILHLLAALIMWAAAYWWYQRHPLIKASGLREPQS